VTDARVAGSALAPYIALLTICSAYQALAVLSRRRTIIVFSCRKAKLKGGAGARKVYWKEIFAKALWQA
jgi:hypothetical protein